MTPGGYMYFDFYQADPKTQPYAIGGYTPIKRAYSYNPVPVDSLTAEESKHIPRGTGEYMDGVYQG